MYCCLLSLMVELEFCGGVVGISGFELALEIGNFSDKGFGRGLVTLRRN